MARRRKARSEVETELKIKLSPESLEKIFNKFLRRSVKDSFNHKFTPRRYFDTEELDLYAKGLSLRVQYAPGKFGKTGGYEQTFKYAIKPDDDGVMVRTEYKVSIDSHLPELEVAEDENVQEMVEGIDNKSLVQIFTASVERRLMLVDVDGGQIELAFDVGNLYLTSPSRATADICEIEVEVKKGKANLIEKVKAEIFKAVPDAVIQPYSKSEQGTRLYAAEFKKKLPKKP